MTTARRVALESAYRATSYYVDGPAGRFAVRIDQPSPEADALAAAHQADRWAYVTAYNPRSTPASEEENRLRQQDLVTAAQNRGFPIYHGQGRGDDGAWPTEPSVLVVGVDAEEAAALARRFGQAAFVYGERGGTARLVWTDADAAGN